MNEKKNSWKIFGDQLRKLRQERGINQSELAEALNINQTMISKWEKGVNFCTGENLDKVAAFFNKPVSYFMGSTEPEKASPSSPSFHNEEIRILKNQIESLLDLLRGGEQQMSKMAKLRDALLEEIKLKDSMLTRHNISTS